MIASILQKGLLLIPFLLPALSAAADGVGFDVLKAHGKIGHYQLYPIHYEPGQAHIVDERLATAPPITFTGPDHYDIPRDVFPAVHDQGGRGTCSNFALVALLEIYYVQKSSIYSSLELSEECLVDLRNWMFDAREYQGSDKPSKRPDPNGDMPKAIIETITHYGIPEAKQYDPTNCTYDGGNLDGADVSLDDYLKITSGDTPASLPFGKNLAFNESLPSIDAIKAMIAKNIPVEVGLVVYNEFREGEADWRYDPKVDTDDQIAGGHATVLVGYRTENGKTIFTFKNSWGDDWGNSGYGTIDDSLLIHSWHQDSTNDLMVTLPSAAEQSFR